ncbi:cyclophilin type peptidyl-prolyl cis-trans isomerase-like protein 1 [Elsinoe australis]|uniref:peptidylprolyl isomerase n=1 Tax=Elsinoe australis TaxID=40998 RepID=A0A4U7BEQ0_9PEZI|nr:cyclophilin type peptidyl-prolyl cis-trans isomerase-like protein 1 [Elsinoe australis]
MDADRPRVFLDVSIDTSPAGRLVIELFSDKAPKTCENFRALCNGSHNDLTYASSPFHRVIDEFMIQGGDITKGDGTGGTSIYGEEFEDENLSWREIDAAGLVCMANRGPGTNSSQFFITLEPTPHLNGKHTIFGRVITGQDLLKTIANVPVDKNDRPKVPVLIARCGELERKRPAKPIAAPAPTSARGRRRQSGSRSRSASRHRSRSISRDKQEEDRLDRRGGDTKKRRRRSDHEADETFRGRPKTRSESRSPARKGSPEAKDERETAKTRTNGAAQSPPRKHRRVRSRSPSRSESRGGRREKLRRSRSRSAEGHEGRRRRHEYRDRDYREGREPKGDRREDWRGDKRRGDGGDRRRRDERDVGRRDDRDERRDNRGGYWDRDRGGTRFGDRTQDSYRGYGQRRNGGGDGRLNDGRLGSDGRLGGDGDDNTPESGIKFKGRGSMKYREPNQRW